MYKKDRVIARFILNAQIGSDAGKNKHLIADLSEHAAYEGYAGKDKYILDAIRMIRASKGESSFRFSVRDGGKVSPYLVYFETKVWSGKKLQVSFHSFNDALKPYAGVARGRHRGLHIRWDHGDSRESAVEIARFFGIID